VKTIEIAAALARRFEGCYLRPYLCPAGVATIGFGATFYPDGRAVTLKDMPITREYADFMLLWMIKNIYMPAVIKLCPKIDTPERAAALIDFAFNLGAGRLKSSTLRKRVNSGQWESVPSELRKWNKGGGRVLRGLTLRREAEIKLI
jgi:lysozyme